MNQIKLCGDIEAMPILSHVNHNREFLSFPLTVKRLSGTYDTIRIIAPTILCTGLCTGTTISVDGELRSYNDREAVHNRLKINAWARDITVCDAPHANLVHMIGSLCKPAIYRRTPFGREIADMMLCVQREYAVGNLRRNDYIPCIAWGSVARLCASLPAKTAIELEGRIQSRTYTKLIRDEAEERVAYEVSIATVNVLDSELEY